MLIRTLCRTRPARNRAAWWHLFAGTAALALAATTVVLADAPGPGRPYAGRTACCKDPSEFTYVALPDHGTVDFELGRKSPLFEFQTGYSVFAAFRLPVLNEPYLVEIRSFLRGGPDPQRAQVLYPMAAFLSDDYLVMRSVGLDAVVPELPIQQRATAPAYRLAVPVDPARARERYLVVYTPYGLVEPGRERPLPSSVETVEETAREAFLGASAEGRLSITIVTAHGSRQAAR